MFIKRDDSKKKSDTPYHPQPHTVVAKKGSMVTAKDGDGNEVTRNSSLFKSMPAENGETMEENEEVPEMCDSA